MPANGSRAPLTLSPLATRRAWFAVEHFEPDVVHFHEPFAPLIGWGVLRAHRAAAVGTFHRSGAGPALRLTEPLLRALARDIDVAVAVSDPAAETIRAACGIYRRGAVQRLRDRAVRRDRARADRRSPADRPSDASKIARATAHAIRAVRAHNATGAPPVATGRHRRRTRARDARGARRAR